VTLADDRFFLGATSNLYQFMGNFVAMKSHEKLHPTETERDFWETTELVTG